MLVDFHMHSIYSDGVKSPEELLRHALECKLSMMALTDHDEIDGIKALHAAQKQLDPEKTIKIINLVLTIKINLFIFWDIVLMKQIKN